MKRRSILLSPLAPLAAQSGAEPAAQRRNDAYAVELEEQFRRFIVDAYPARAAKAWQRDYSSPEALVKSVEPNRRLYRTFVAPPDLKATAALQRAEYEIPQAKAEWLTLPLGSRQG